MAFFSHECRPEATRAIASLEASAQIEVLRFRQRLSENPTEEVYTPERIASLPNVFQSRVGPDYRILWKPSGWPPEKIAVLKLFRAPAAKLAMDC